MKISTMAYTAGLVDGEGSIQINPHNKYWSLCVQVSGCCFETLDGLQKEWLLGSVSGWTPTKGRAKQRSYNWRIYSAGSEVFLKAILPFLKTKREHAEIALEFRKFSGNYKRGQITSEIREKRKILALSLRELNRRYGKGKIRDLNLEEII